MAGRPIKPNKPKLKTLALKIPDTIIKEMKRISENEARSVNAQVKVILEKFIEDYKSVRG